MGLFLMGLVHTRKSTLKLGYDPTTTMDQIWVQTLISKNRKAQ